MLIVESKGVVEVKSIELNAAVDKKQLLTYLRLTDKKLGLLINFNVDLIERNYANRLMLRRKGTRKANTFS
ncbi:MAG: GxxExxY protein [Pyrinomonadaceae bacterium]